MQHNPPNAPVLSRQIPRAKITDLPSELLEEIFLHFINDLETLRMITETSGRPSLVAQNIMASVKSLVVRGHTVTAECNYLLRIATPTLTPQIRYLDLTFSCRDAISPPLPASFRQLIAGTTLPALREITVHVTDLYSRNAGVSNAHTLN